MKKKVADLGLSLEQIGADLGGMVGGGFVNRFDIAGRSYKVIPQVMRARRLNPEQLGDLHVTGPNGQVVALSLFVSPREIGELLSLSEETIKARVKTILSKLGARDRTHAVVIALQRGLIRL